MATEPQPHLEPTPGWRAGRIGVPDSMFTTFSKYGLLGCTVGFICLAFWYMQHNQTETLAWAFARIEAEQEAARIDREATWRKVSELKATMDQALAELRSGRSEIKAAVKSVERKVESLEP